MGIDEVGKLTKWELTKWELTKWEVDQMGIDEVGIDKVGINPDYLCCPPVNYIMNASH